MADPASANLERLARLLDGGTHRVPIQRSCGFAQTGEALLALPAGHTQGKIGLAFM